MYIDRYVCIAGLLSFLMSWPESTLTVDYKLIGSLKTTTTKNN